MSGAPPRSPPRSGRTTTSRPAIPCCRRHANSNAASPPPSTPRCSRSSSAMSTGCASELAERGYDRDFLVMNGNGGMISARFVTQRGGQDRHVRPRLRRHGGGLYGAAAPAIENLVTYDMGGTSTDVALIRNAAGRRLQRDRDRIRHADPRADGGRAHGRRRRRLDRAGGRGGAAPGRAAKAPAPTPGPICYGRGGTEPTIIGRQPAARPPRPQTTARRRQPRGSAALRDAFAREARTTGSASIGAQAAGAVLRIGNIKMAGAIRMVSIARGHDPRDFALFAFGGAGPLHASALGARTRHPEGAGAGAAGHHQRAWLRRRRPAARFRQHAQPARRAARHGEYRDRRWRGRRREGRA